MFINKYTYKVCIPVLWLLFSALLVSCKEEKKEGRKIERSFYYWKSVFKLTAFEKHRQDSLQVKTIYLKFFDVGWDGEKKMPVPIAKLQTLPDKYNDSFLINPVVFITNECIQKIDSAQVLQLADDVNSLLHKIIEANSFNSIGELQFDCDWTATTKDNYFRFLKATKKIWVNTAMPISATIRLHQIKFLSKTGVPPVDRGLLMCYNMGNLKNPATTNSIIETTELKKYIGNLSGYPLPLDVALPLFSWKVLYRKNIYSGLIENLPNAFFTSDVALQKDNRFEILKDTLLQGYDLKKGDVLRNEESDFKEIIASAAAISNKLKNTPLKVCLYHLDSLILNKYSLNELEAIYNSLR